MTWSLRTDLLMLSPLPSGSIFGVSGMGSFAHSVGDGRGVNEVPVCHQDIVQRRDRIGWSSGPE